MNDNKIFNNLKNLKKLRLERNLTQLQLSIALGVAQETISKYEIGVAYPQPSMLIKIADYFHVSVDYLLGRTEVQGLIVLPAKINNPKFSEIYNKYMSLSDKDKYTFDQFLEFLSKKKSSINHIVTTL